jgi:3-oxoacyl-[acyl-carrier-protein] synthase II
MRRVVVTGIGAITPLGVGIRHTWKRILGSDCGIVSTRSLPLQEQFQDIPSQVAGLVPLGARDEGKWTASDWLNKSDERRMAQFTQYAVAATEGALEDAGWRPTTQAERESTGICLGSGIGNFKEVVDTSIAYHNEVGKRKKSGSAPAIGLLEPVLSFCRATRRSLLCSYLSS